MKRKVLFLFFLFIQVNILSSQNASRIYAGGTCTATINTLGSCIVSSNSCTGGDFPYSFVDAGTGGCTCQCIGSAAPSSFPTIIPPTAAPTSSVALPSPTIGTTGSGASGGKSLCESIGDPNGCKDCMDQEGHVWTALGCLDTSSGGFVNVVITLGIGIGGGIALLLILFGALQMMTSAGNPEKLTAGKELVTAAITGLLFIIFSIFILRLIGYTILKIPSFIF